MDFDLGCCRYFVIHVLSIDRRFSFRGGDFIVGGQCSAIAILHRRVSGSSDSDDDTKHSTRLRLVTGASPSSSSSSDPPPQRALCISDVDRAQIRQYSGLAFPPVTRGRPGLSSRRRSMSGGRRLIRNLRFTSFIYLLKIPTIAFCSDGC